jgi:DNA repair protein RecO (recombination protein O)
LLHKTRGIVFRAIKYSNTSIITTIYTEQFGLQTYIVNGARSAKSKKAPLFQPATILDLVVYKRENKNIQHIKEIKLEVLYRRLPLQVVRSSVALFIIETLLKCVQEEETNPALFEFIVETLSFLDECETVPALLPQYFLIELSKHLGFHPQDKFTEATPYFDMREGHFTSKESNLYSFSSSMSRLFSELKEKGRGELNVFQLPHLQRKELLDALVTFYTLHVTNFKKLKSLDVLEEVFRN